MDLNLIPRLFIRLGLWDSVVFSDETKSIQNIYSYIFWKSMLLSSKFFGIFPAIKN